jgi:putative SOS response-associated peptidase YedK
VCNLYSIITNQEAMRRLFRVKHDRAGNLPSLPSIFPDQLAPVVRLDRDGERVMEMMRWGFTAEARDASGDERAQHGKLVLAALAQVRVPLPSAGDIILRIHRQSTEGAALVRPR